MQSQGFRQGHQVSRSQPEWKPLRCLVSWSSPSSPHGLLLDSACQTSSRDWWFSLFLFFSRPPLASLSKILPVSWSAGVTGISERPFVIFLATPKHMGIMLLSWDANTLWAKSDPPGLTACSLLPHPQVSMWERSTGLLTFRFLANLRFLFFPCLNLTR